MRVRLVNSVVYGDGRSRVEQTWKNEYSEAGIELYVGQRRSPYDRSCPVLCLTRLLCTQGGRRPFNSP